MPQSFRAKGGDEGMNPPQHERERALERFRQRIGQDGIRFQARSKEHLLRQIRQIVSDALEGGEEE